MRASDLHCGGGVRNPEKPGGAAMILPLVVIIASAVAVSAGIYLTVRGFKASAARAAAGDGNGQQPGAAADAALSRHDQATIDLLKRFFDGKECALCKRAIPAVQRTG